MTGPYVGRRGPGRRWWLLTSVAVVAACGADESEPADDAAISADTEVAWVPPRDTDIVLADLTLSADGALSIGTPRNITQRADYDNQPAFTPDGEGLLYTATDPQSAQADIWRYELDAGTVSSVTSTAPESEYSAIHTLDGSGVTVIRVEADSTQRLWYIPVEGDGERPVFEDVAPVGYYAQTDPVTYWMFVLGSPPTLVRDQTDANARRVVAEDIGRSIHRIPGTEDVSFVQRHPDGSATIMRVSSDDTSATPTEIAPALGDGDFHAWTPDGRLLMAEGGRIAVFDEAGGAWVDVADFTDLSISISRLAVHPSGRQIAWVAEPAMDLLPGN